MPTLKNSRHDLKQVIAQGTDFLHAMQLPSRAFQIFCPPHPLLEERKGHHNGNAPAIEESDYAPLVGTHSVRSNTRKQPLSFVVYRVSVPVKSNLGHKRYGWRLYHDSVYGGSTAPPATFTTLSISLKKDPR